MNLKPIETVYKGYRFRSRLEARWAVFFSSLGIDWSYEPEGFDLDDAGRYLPDFWLPRENIWIEVKPVWPDRAERLKAHRLHDYSGKPVVFLIGIPPGQFLLITEDVSSSSGGTSWWVHNEQDHHDIVFFRGMLSFALAAGEDKSFEGNSVWSLADLFDAPDFSSVAEVLNPIITASKAARFARFEHGEVPA